MVATVLKPLHPGLSRIKHLSTVVDMTDQTFDPKRTLDEYPMTLTRLEDFIRERVRDAARGKQ